MKASSFEQFPYWIVAACNGVGLAIYACGLYLTFRLGVAWGVLYALFCGWMEWRLLSTSCRRCYYFGKRCGFGKGRLSALFFTKAQGPAACAKAISWWHVIPDFLVSLIPVGIGIGLLIARFSWLVLLSVLAVLILASAGTGIVRGQLACRYCRQRELGCPAEQLFNKSKPA